MRWRPMGFATRLALLVFAVAVLGHLLFGAAWVGGHVPSRVEDLRTETASRMAAVVELLAATPKDRLPLALEAVATPLLDVRLAPAAPFADDRESWVVRRFHAWLALQLEAALAPRPVLIRHLDRWSHGDAAPPPWHGPALEVAVAEPALGWVVFTVDAGILEPRPLARLMGFLLLAGLALAGLSALAGRRMAAPLRRLAAAAERLGQDLAAPPVPETGSRELRQAARAFNRMQVQLARFVGDRLRILAALSHDLRTALTRLRLRVELIDDPEQRAKAEADLAAMETMLTTTLAYARAEAAGEPLARVDVAALVQTACDDLRDAGHAVEGQVEGRYVLRCRPVALRRAIDNLLGNAIRYAEAAEVGVERRADRLEIRIADRGPGIPAALRERVFEPFYRIEASRSVETGGAGLGLTVARSVARDHGGDIELADRPGGGLVATLWLPLEERRA